MGGGGPARRPWDRLRRSARADEGPPGPAVVALVAAVQPLLGPAERWAVYTVPGPRDLPGPGAPRGRRDRWWREHVSAVAGAVVVTEPGLDLRAVQLAVRLVTALAAAREDGVVEPAVVAGRLGPWVPLPGERAPVVLPPVSTALEVVRCTARTIAVTVDLAASTARRRGDPAASDG